MTAAGGTVTEIESGSQRAVVRWTGQADEGTFLEAIGYTPSKWLVTWSDTLAGASGSLLAATEYEIDITMSPDTVAALTTGRYSLYGFKAVQTTVGGGAPLVWFKVSSPNYSESTQITWSVQYAAYTSSSKIIPGGRIAATFTRDIDLGQTLNRRADGGDVTRGGPRYAITIRNHTETEYTCGISQKSADGGTNPMCAFPLYGLNDDVIAPIEKVLLMFASEPVNTGTVLERSYGRGVLVDLTSANERALRYDINKSWSWGGYSWAQTVPPNQELVPLLVERVPAPPAGEGVTPAALVLG